MFLKDGKSCLYLKRTTSHSQFARWHIVLNIEESIAITQNYISRRNLIDVLEFLECKPDQISGTSTPLQLLPSFKAAYEAKYPGEIEKLTQERTDKLASRQSLWDKIKSTAHDEDQQHGAFSFGFD